MDIVRSATFSSQQAYQPISDQQIQDETVEQRPVDDKETVTVNNLRYSQLIKQPLDSQQDRMESNPAIVTQPSKGLWAATGIPALRWMTTPKGFLITIYGLNVVAWGGMLFLLMCNAAPAMCNPDCNSINSSRRIWIEIDSQILNALFCVTGFGLAPWRIRDLYFWCLWRLGRSEGSRERGFTRLADIHATWFLRSQVPASVLPTTCPSAETELMRVTSTPPWKMDAVVWGNMLNTIFQICLALCMWTMNRHNRPSWTTGLFVGLACLVVGVAGIVTWLETKRVQKARKCAPGTPLSTSLHTTTGSKQGSASQEV
ncbi:hypothetical protein BBP40_011348 [Aspergillus hancockii]|nr:hypothetical protein BBP40_011348 [Aspergillus hancockii]